MNAPLTHGSCASPFQLVRDAFAENFSKHGEIGAAVCIYKDGQQVVDLWGGIADPATDTPWDRNTIVCMMSVGKAMAALCVLRLVDRGLIDLDAPVIRYWPEFGQAGKSEITVRTLLGGLAGLIYADHAPSGSAFDWNVMVQALEKQEPVWTPGTVGAYHSMTAGHLFGELVRRVDGRMINVFFAEEIASPLGVDYLFGLADTDMARTATIIPNPGSTTFTQIADPTSKLGRAWRILPREPDIFNSKAFRRSIFPSASGHGNARAIARIYAALGNNGSLDGYQILSPSLIDTLRAPSWEGECGLTGRDFRYGLGFFVSCAPLTPFGDNPRAFGHPGAGGAVGFTDPEAGLAFSYSPNFCCAGAGVGERCEGLIAAMFACV